MSMRYRMEVLSLMHSRNLLGMLDPLPHAVCRSPLFMHLVPRHIFVVELLALLS